MNDGKENKKIFLKIGFVLVAISYLLWAPALLFLSLSIAGETGLWSRLAGITYAVSWVFFIAGFLLAGSDGTRLARHWILAKFKRNPNSSQTSDSPDQPQQTHPDNLK